MDYNFPPLEGGKSAKFKEKGKVFRLQRLDADKKFDSINPIVSGKFLKRIFPNGFSNRGTLRNGDCLVEAILKTDLAIVCKEGKIDANLPYLVKVSLHESLNYSKRTFVSNQLVEVSIEELQEELTNQKVIKVERIKYMKDGVLSDSNRYILTFDSLSPPELIQIGHLRIKINKYFESPLFCSNCNKYRHTKKYCRNQSTCKKCAKSHETADSCGPVLCINCQGPHPANFKDCSVKKQEIEIRRIEANQNISPVEARRKFFGQKRTRNFSAVVAASIPAKDPQIELLIKKMDEIQKTNIELVKTVSSLKEEIVELKKENEELKTKVQNPEKPQMEVDTISINSSEISEEEKIIVSPKYHIKAKETNKDHKKEPAKEFYFSILHNVPEGFMTSNFYGYLKNINSKYGIRDITYSKDPEKATYYNTYSPNRYTLDHTGRERRLPDNPKRCSLDCMGT